MILGSHAHGLHINVVLSTTARLYWAVTGADNKVIMVNQFRL